MITINEPGAIETYIGNFATKQTLPAQGTTTFNQKYSNNILKAAGDPTISNIRKSK